jgi:aspartate aminotransferase
VTYPEQVRLVEATPVFVPTDESAGFEVDPDRIRQAVTPRTRALILNSPNNPTGAVFDAESLKAIAALAIERDLWVISDECYAALSYDGPVPSIATLGPEVQARTIVVNTCSKAYAMTGWRIGYAAGPRPVIKAMADFQSQCTSNPTTIAMWAAVEALTGPQHEVATMAREFDRRRHAIVNGLNAIPGVRCTMPKGAFYAFPNIFALFSRRWRGRPLASSTEVATCLLEEGRVAVVPGLDFGADHHVRLSYATSLTMIQEGLERIRRVVGLLDA